METYTLRVIKGHNLPFAFFIQSIELYIQCIKKFIISHHPNERRVIGWGKLIVRIESKIYYFICNIYCRFSIDPDFL